MIFITNCAETNGFPHAKEWLLTPIVHPYAKSYNYKMLIRKYRSMSLIGNDFLGMISKSQTKTEKLYWFELRFKTFVPPRISLKEKHLTHCIKVKF